MVRISKLGLGLAAVMLAAGSVAAKAADPRLGSWVLTSAQSSLDPPDKLSIVSANGTVHVLMTGETHLEFTAQTDGKQSPVPANPAFDQIQLHRISAKKIEVMEKKNGALVATIRNEVGKDGALTLTTMRPGHADQVSVWTRVGVKKGNDPFAGDWVQDVSRTRMKQGMVLKIDASGGDGVHFAGEYSYTAKFDGKPYDVRNSRNDTVQLAQPDSHTVTATFLRDQKVAQEDKWVVAADGRTMTLTSTGTLETGQRFKEVLVFQKQ